MTLPPMAMKWLRLLFWTFVGAIFVVILLTGDWHNPSRIFSLSPGLFVVVLALALAVVWSLNYGTIAFRSWTQEYRDLGFIVVVLAVALVGGFQQVAGVGKLVATASPETICRIAALWALAYLSVGFLAGFLFGIPRVFQGDAAQRSNQSGASESKYDQRVNTNLEQISDWLTKIIVGLGLVELRRVPDHLYNASTWMAQSLVAKEHPVFAQAASFCNSIIIFFAVIGFLAGYLMTRLFLAGAFRRADVPSETQASGVSKDDAAEKLRRFWKPNGKDVDAGDEQKLLKWMEENGLISPQNQIDIASFILLSKYAQERAKAVADLKIE